MTEQDDDLVLLMDMKGAAEEALSYLSKKTHDEFVQDKMCVRACERCIEIFGEAASNIKQITKQKHTEIPWRIAKDMRNRLIHGYDSIRSEIVYKTLTEHFPALLENIKSIILEFQIGGN